MALNRLELACYHRQRKQGLLTQLVYIIAGLLCFAITHYTVQAEMFHNHANIQTVPARQFSESCRGSVWFGSACD